MSPLRQLWDGRPTYGGWCTIPSAVSAEIVGRAGFDWVCVDTQHGLIGFDAMVPMLQALTAAGTPSLVRVAWNDPPTIMKTLDAGAEGVIVPMVNTAAQAREAVAACRYPPHGNRSWGPIRPRLLNPDYSIDSAQDVVCAVMCETVEAIANLDAILAVPGIDAVFVGPNDLAISMGIKGSTYAGEVSEHRAAMVAIAAACGARSIIAGIMCGTPEVAEQWRREGFSMLAIESDARLLGRAAMADASRSRQLGGGH